MGMTPLDPLEQHELQRRLAAGYTKVSERAVPVPRVGLGAPRPRAALIDIVPHRKAEEEIRQEFDNFATPSAPHGAPVRSSDDKKDELALRNQFYGRTPQEVLANAPPKPPPVAPKEPSLRTQIEDEVAERHEFLDNMKRLQRMDRATEERVRAEIADRLQDLQTLERLGGEE